MRVIVSGGTGFIGRALTASLVAKGFQVVVLSRRPRPSGPGGNPQFAVFDGRSAQGWGELADGAKAIINLAGENIASGRFSPKKKRGILDSRVQAGQAMLQAVRQAKVAPEVLIQASAQGYYGLDCSGGCAEDAPAGRGFLAEVARQWEDSTLAVESLGVRRAVIRSAVVLGAQGGALARLLTPFKYFLGGPLGSGLQGFPWISLRDEVRAIEFLLDNPEAQGPFNLCAPDIVDMREFCRRLGRVMGRPSLLPVPAFILRLVFGEMADEALLSGCQAYPSRLLELGFKFEFGQLEAALRDILGTR